MQNQLAVLIALAGRPKGRATFDELDADIARLAAEPDDGNAARFSAFENVDVVESGLVAHKGDGIRITLKGWSLLHALAIAPPGAPGADFASPLQSLNLIDDLIGAEARERLFDSGARLIDQHADDISQTGEDAYVTAQPAVHHLPAETDHRPLDADHLTPTGDEAPHRVAPEIVADAPPFLVRNAGAAPQKRSSFLTRLTARLQQGGTIWRRHLQADEEPKGIMRSGANLDRGLLALLSLLVLVSCAAAVVALMQIRSLRSELTTLQRELPPLRERVARLDQIERARELPAKAADQKVQPPRENRVEETALQLSREEIQLVRDYIKPAPIVGAAAAPTKVGDPVTGTMLPFPSPVTDKVPKLLGARFAIKNGAIIIVRKDSRQADVVIGPN